MDWLTTLKALAPTVASAFLGPLGGIAVAAVGNLLGVSDATQDKIAQAIQNGQMTPEQVTQLKTLELEYQANEKERGFRYAELAFKDRDSAREMQKSTRSWVPASLSVIITVGFLGLLTGMMTGYLRAEDNQAMLLMLGALGVAFGQVINFWLGSTAESGRKTEIIAQAPAK